VRSNSGDEEIRRLTRLLASTPSSEVAERLAILLRRRETGRAGTVLSFQGLGEPRTYYEIDHASGLTTDDVIQRLEAAVAAWLERHADQNDLDWGSAMSLLEEEDWERAGLVLTAVMQSDGDLPTHDTFSQTPRPRDVTLRDRGSGRWDLRRRSVMRDAMRAWSAQHDMPRGRGLNNVDVYLLDEAIQALSQFHQHAASRADRRIASELLEELDS